jgi:hypothetical protein
MMNIARSAFYYRPKEPSPETGADIGDHIEAICLEFPKYGYRPVTKQLQRDGKVINHKKVLRMMQKSDLFGQAKRKWSPGDFEQLALDYRNREYPTEPS